LAGIISRRLSAFCGLLFGTIITERAQHFYLPGYGLFCALLLRFWHFNDPAVNFIQSRNLLANNSDLAVFLPASQWLGVASENTEIRVTEEAG